MPDPARYARLLCDWCLRPEPGDQVVVSTTTLAAEPALALQRELLEREAHPLLRLSLPGQDEVFWANASDVHLDAHAPLELTEAETTQASVRIEAPSNTNSRAGVDPARIARFARGRAAVREAALRRRWCVSIWPTPALAQQAGMSTRDYAGFVHRALLLDRDDPVAAWQELSERQASLVERLGVAREIRIEAEGTDLALDVSGRTWINSDGRRNMPSGEVFTGPVESSAEGRIRFTVPTSPSGVDVAGVELEFREGRVVGARAERGEDFLRAMLATDDGASRLGELGIGTNRGIDRATGEILLDEKIGGTVHLAIGRSYPETGGVNESAVHWDLICDLRDGGRLTADGETVTIP
jgi:aminopeptidase